MAVTASQIASWLKAQRSRTGLSQGDAAKLAGVSSDAISKWERGEKGIMAENFVALVLAYNAGREITEAQMRLAALNASIAESERASGQENALAERVAETTPGYEPEQPTVPTSVQPHPDFKQIAKAKTQAAKKDKARTKRRKPDAA